MTYLAACFLTPFLFLLLGWTLPDSAVRRSLGPVVCLSLLSYAWSSRWDLTPLQRLMFCSLWLLFSLKGWGLLLSGRDEVRQAPPLGLLLYSYLWPSPNPEPFLLRQEAAPTAARCFAWGFPTTCLGIAGLLVTALGSHDPWSKGQTYAALLMIGVAVHFGFSDVLTSIMRLLGFSVPRLFDAPLASLSLNDFWTKRWNRPFVDMNRLLFRPLLRPVLGPQATVMAIFLLSGVLHELAISFPAGRGWGGPLLYFALHGGLMLAEKGWKIERWPSLARRVWTWFWLLAPVPLLFHLPFREALIAPLLQSMHAWPPLSDIPGFLAWTLTLAGYGHFLILVASFQVPSRLGWKEELPRLRPLNRKIVWVYGGYIVGMIVSLGVLTLHLSPEMLRGDKAALAIAGLTAVFWWSRVGVDALVFEHADWPSGHEFVLGHTCLTTLFVTLASIYTTLLLWHACG